MTLRQWVWGIEQSCLSLGTALTQQVEPTARGEGVVSPRHSRRDWFFEARHYPHICRREHPL